MQDFEVILVDFDDSFTMNIAEYLFRHYISYEIIHYSDLTKYKVNDINQKKIIILGPGPGAPNEYVDAKAFVQHFLMKKNTFFLGICLGHQIILNCLGSKLVRRIKPSHGNSRSILLPNWPEFFSHSSNLSKSIEVQEYNSLVVNKKSIKFTEGVDYHWHDDELMMARGRGFLSYQFHPESIGTSGNDIFFNVLKRKEIWLN